MVRIKYCANCAKKRDWQVTGETKTARCSICSERHLCFSEDSTKLPSYEKYLPPKKDTVDKKLAVKPKSKIEPKEDALDIIIGRPSHGIGQHLCGDPPSPALKRGRKPGRLTAAKARKLKEKHIAATIENIMDDLLEKVAENIAVGNIAVSLEEDLLRNKGHLLKKIEKTLTDLGYEVEVSKTQIRIKW